eukprot:CAMPEP_0195602056 /NCGR_PEP_ID=MMETSP0815-20121206/5405_1 /TAXON_ID=97485 /ORGANISM="Prymnesium parvum, Strain Texoma1" /LENGTH=380 /DNA_ID=CAMNT_0040741619 /DNA_START=467 /DNA_END=1606 /DNA_ORIENTATION=-
MESVRAAEHPRARAAYSFKGEVGQPRRRGGAPPRGAAWVGRAVVGVDEDAMGERRAVGEREIGEAHVGHVAAARGAGLDVRRAVRRDEPDALEAHVRHAAAHLGADGDARARALARDVARGDVRRRPRVRRAEAVPPRLDRNAVVAAAVARVLDQHVPAGVRVPPVGVGREQRRLDPHAAHVHAVAVEEVSVPVRRVDHPQVGHRHAPRGGELNQVAPRVLLDAREVAEPPVRALPVDHRAVSLAADGDVVQPLAAQQRSVPRAAALSAAAVRRQRRDEGPEAGVGDRAERRAVLEVQLHRARQVDRPDEIRAVARRSAGHRQARGGGGERGDGQLEGARVVRPAVAARTEVADVHGCAGRGRRAARDRARHHQSTRGAI